MRKVVIEATTDLSARPKTSSKNWRPYGTYRLAPDSALEGHQWGTGTSTLSDPGSGDAQGILNSGGGHQPRVTGSTEHGRFTGLRPLLDFQRYLADDVVLPLRFHAQRLPGSTSRGQFAASTHPVISGDAPGCFSKSFVSSLPVSSV